MFSTRTSIPAMRRMKEELWFLPGLNWDSPHDTGLPQALEVFWHYKRARMHKIIKATSTLIRCYLSLKRSWLHRLLWIPSDLVFCSVPKCDRHNAQWWCEMVEYLSVGSKPHITWPLDLYHVKVITQFHAKAFIRTPKTRVFVNQEGQGVVPWCGVPHRWSHICVEAVWWPLGHSEPSSLCVRGASEQARAEDTEATEAQNGERGPSRVGGKHKIIRD